MFNVFLRIWVFVLVGLGNAVLCIVLRKISSNIFWESSLIGAISTLMLSVVLFYLGASLLFKGFEQVEEKSDFGSVFYKVTLFFNNHVPYEIEAWVKKFNPMLLHVSASNIPQLFGYIKSWERFVVVSVAAFFFWLTSLLFLLSMVFFWGVEGVRLGRKGLQESPLKKFIFFFFLAAIGGSACGVAFAHFFGWSWKTGAAFGAIGGPLFLLTSVASSILREDDRP